MNNKGLLPQPYESKHRTRVRLVLIFLTLALMFSAITSVTFAAGEDLLGKIGDQIVEWLKGLLFPDPPKCNCTAVGQAHYKGEFYSCVNRESYMKTWDSVKQFAWKAIQWAAGVSNEANINLANMLSLFDNTAFVQLWNGTITSLYNVFATCGMVLVAMYWVLEILDASTRESLNMEFVIRSTIKLLIAAVLIMNGLNLMRMLIEFSDLLLKEMTAPVNGNPTMIDAVYNEFEAAIFWDYIGLFLSKALDFGGQNAIITLVYELAVYSRFLELGVRVAFAPIGMANIYQGGLNSSGGRYLKKIAAIGLHGAMMLALILIRNQWRVGLPELFQLILELALIGLLFKSRKWAEELVGV